MIGEQRKLVLSASAEAIRRAFSPREALTLFNLRLRRLVPPDPFDPHAAVFTLKSFSSSVSLRRSLTPILHAYLLKTHLLSFTYVASALLHSSLFSPVNARNLFDDIPCTDLVLTNTMISCFCRNGDVSSARLLFDSCPDKDVVSWSAMISGYMQKNDTVHDGLSLFRKMMLQGKLKPDASLLVTLLSGCASVGSMQLLSRSIHGYAVKNLPHKEMSSQLGTSLVTMYTKASDLRCVLSVFEQIAEKNVMHWTCMIGALAMHGHSDEAITLFQEMRDSGVKPNEYTFTTILNVCCHAGLIDQAQKFFAIMVQELKLKPKLQHYVCLVHLFAKAGRLDEAYGVIKCMEVKPNIVIWTSFLEACKKYKKFEMAKEGIEKVLGMARPDKHGGVYTLVSDLYALGGRWADAERVRRLMDQQNIAKVAGLSSIVLNEMVESL